MAKGDDQRARNNIQEQGGLAQNHLDNTRNTIVPQNQYLWNNYQNSVDQAKQDYSGLKSKFDQWSKDGGFSGDDLSNIRGRAIAPTRAVYANANRDIDRGRNLNGGYSPNFAASKAKLAREMSMGMNDASLNAEGMIAQMKNAGKQFGLSGEANLYSATPGMASMFGNQLSNSNRDLLATQGMQNDLSLGRMKAMNDAAQIKGKWQQTYDNILNGGKTLANVWTAGTGS